MKRNALDSPQALYCDASYLIAFFAKQDQSHKKAIAIRKSFTKRPPRLYTSWPIISEAMTLLLYHYGYSYATALKKSFPAFEIMTPLETEYARAIELFEHFNKDQQFSLNDLLSKAILEKRLKSIPILTFDCDFYKMGVQVFEFAF